MSIYDPLPLNLGTVGRSLHLICCFLELHRSYRHSASYWSIHVFKEIAARKVQYLLLAESMRANYSVQSYDIKAHSFLNHL
jgi:hypothetical protein